MSNERTTLGHVSGDQSLSPWCPCLRRRTIDGCLG
jgi:hypothetical protein